MVWRARASLRFATALAALFWSLVMPARAELPPLIPREVLFGNPHRLSPQLSPDGTKLAWLAPDAQGVLQVWLRTIASDDERCVTSEKKRPVRSFFWARNNRVLLYTQDADGDENYHLFGVDLASGNIRDYTPFQGVKTGIALVNPKFPDEMLVSLNARDRRLFDVYRLDMTSGALVLDTENLGDVATYYADPEFRIRAATVVTPEGGTELRVRDAVGSDWRTWLAVGPEEILDFLDFAGDGRSAFLRSSLASDTARIVQRALDTDDQRVLASSDQVDAGAVLIHPQEHVVEAVAFAPDRSRWQIVDERVGSDLGHLAALDGGDLSVISRDHADGRWLVAFNGDRGPNRFFMWDRQSKRGQFLFSHQPQLEGLELAEMQPVVIESRDRLTLRGYLTLPAGLPPKSLPMVLVVHGVPGGATNGVITPRPSGWPTVVMPACRSISALRPATARPCSTRATGNGGARCTTTCSTRSSGPSTKGTPTRHVSRSSAARTAATPRCAV